MDHYPRLEYHHLIICTLLTYWWPENNNINFIFSLVCDFYQLVPFWLLLTDDTSQHLLKKNCTRIYATRWRHKWITKLFSVLKNGGSYVTFGTSPGLELNTNSREIFDSQLMCMHTEKIQYYSQLTSIHDIRGSHESRFQNIFTNQISSNFKRGNYGHWIHLL